MAAYMSTVTNDFTVRLYIENRIGKQDLVHKSQALEALLDLTLHQELTKNSSGASECNFTGYR